MGPNSVLALDSQRKLARTILIGIVLVVSLFVLFASGPTFGFSFAQQQETRVEFLNPSGTNFSEEMSSKPNASGANYHLVAWVNQLPSNAAVEFRYVDPDSGQQVTIGSGTQSAQPDTFHVQWNPPASLPDEGEFTVIAVLFSGTTEVDRDTESDVILNNGDPSDPLDPTEARGETVEITYPLIGGSWGVFQPRDRATAGVIRVNMSSGVTFVRTVYTISLPGNEPTWIDCGEEEKPDAEDGVRCTLSSQHDMSQVTAVGAVANDTQEDPILGLSYDQAEDDAGDAHRVAPYYQSPTTLVLNQSSQSNAAVGNCSALFTATLTDQFQVPIANANMDVHAKGPAEDIAFDNGSVASANRAPDQGSHTTEAARNCSQDPPTVAGQQGEHVSPTDLDIKHVESSLAAGTNDAGKWSFQLFSPAAGLMDFVVWSDHDDDDTFCSLEKSASGTIGWGGAAGTPALTAETPTCASPSPTSPNPGPTTPGPTPTDNPRGCTQFGTDDSDTLEGTEDADVICGGKGNDIIKGLNGNDRIYGDAGNDDIRGGAGNDNIHGGTGKDTIRGNGGNDSLSGEVGNDVVVGGGGDDSLSGQAGTDTARGGGGDDSVGGQAGPDNLTGGPGKDKLVGGSGDDSLDGGPKKDRCNGSGGQDTFSGCERKRG